MSDPDRPEVQTDQEGHGGFGPQTLERVRLVFERSRLPMLIVDDHRHWVTGNAAAGALLGLLRNEIPWFGMDDYTLPSDLEAFKVQWAAFLSRGQAGEGWNRICVPGRGEVRVEYSATANILPGRHLSVAIPLDDGGPDQESAEFVGTWAGAGAGTEATSRFGLTDREREVMTLVAGGLRNVEIATQMYLSPETVKSHANNAMGKLGVHTRAHAVAVALVSGEIVWGPGSTSVRAEPGVGPA